MRESAHSDRARLFFRWAGRLYLSLFRYAGNLILIVCGIVLFAVLITLPLWYAATTYPGLYTGLVLGAIGLGLLRLLIGKAAGVSRDDLFRSLRKGLVFLLLLLFIYLFTGFIASSRFAAAAITAVPMIGTAGLLLGENPVFRRRS
jgi:xanthine/uracil permease